MSSYEESYWLVRERIDGELRIVERELDLDDGAATWNFMGGDSFMREYEFNQKFELVRELDLEILAKDTPPKCGICGMDPRTVIVGEIKPPPPEKTRVCGFCRAEKPENCFPVNFDICETCYKIGQDE